MSKNTKTCALLLGLFASCSPTSESSDETPSAFQFGTTEECVVNIRVMRDGLPVQAASITITDQYTQVADTFDSALDAVGETLFQGGTRVDGVCRSLIAIPSRFPVVDVVVQARGMRGPYTDELLRAKWGPFAPSSRVTVGVEDLSSLTIEMESQ